MRMRGVAGVVVAVGLGVGLAGCAGGPELVGAQGDLQVAADGGMTFCPFAIDPGFSGAEEPCLDGIETTGVDVAAVEAPSESVVVDPSGQRSERLAGGLARTTADGTRIYSVFLVGDVSDDVFEVSEVGAAAHTLPEEYAAPRFETPGGFLVPVVPR
ncbi:hypothetical protein [Rathayibacter sp. VKM Ac-2760]|uniref:hypothetical protein n=1 Tax=Rathayibacter sp. VKM Ac-2760 TaxID=2609253 RepID=UPI0013171348|nr:hypothetical protein [Rathayibacter sp. VKM Ac-2760]QHC57542.1 hypothetical protein GSU72_02295 [Rathayibacter sp. VKM Ac-2760]